MQAPRLQSGEHARLTPHAFNSLTKAGCLEKFQSLRNDARNRLVSIINQCVADDSGSDTKLAPQLQRLVAQADAIDQDELEVERSPKFLHPTRTNVVSFIPSRVTRRD